MRKPSNSKAYPESSAAIPPSVFLPSRVSIHGLLSLPTESEKGCVMYGNTSKDGVRSGRPPAWECMKALPGGLRNGRGRDKSIGPRTEVFES